MSGRLSTVRRSHVPVMEKTGYADVGRGRLGGTDDTGSVGRNFFWPVFGVGDLRDLGEGMYVV